MANIKVIEEPREVWWETTNEGILEVDGVAVDYRWNETPNGVHLFLYEDATWTSDPSNELSDTYDLLWEMFLEGGVDYVSTEGEEFNFDLEDE